MKALKTSLLLAVATAAATFAGCFTTKVFPTRDGSDDSAHDATGERGDAAAPDSGSGGAMTTGTGGAGTGGAMGTGGQSQTGGTGGGGRVGTGGVVGSGGLGSGGAGIGTGGQMGSGGAGTGGAATGGRGTGGAGTGGMGTGGAATGGRGSGGAGTGGMGTGGAGTGGATDPDLVLWYKFDESSGTTAADSSGNARNGTLTNVGAGTAMFSTTNRVPPGSVNLTSSSGTVGGYVVVPASLNAMGATTAITIAAWVQVRTARGWQKVFDFGNGSTTASSYAFLTTQHMASTPNAPRFAITTTGNMMEQVINMSTPAALPTGWHHMAVVLGTGTTYTGTLYIDKVAVGTNTAMIIRPSDLGATTQNWIGRSQYTTSDPLFDGYIDDFRVYKRALTAAEIAALP